MKAEYEYSFATESTDTMNANHDSDQIVRNEPTDDRVGETQEILP